MLIELSFKRIIREPIQSRYLILLQELNNDNKRYLQIYIGEKEGEHVEAWVQSIVPPRPMTYDLIHEILNLSDTVKLSKVIIDGCDKCVFHAKLFFNIDGIEKVIDARPSDAIAIGLRLNVPIYVEPCILDEYGILLLNK